ncbi:Long-chain-fatty-acid--CoA ligase [Bacillus subtilis]|uniref:amino acid adenylation domain-containing protein n=1 Tax=Bacillus subtilis TaxID=1423 RepID=UPI0005ADFFBA|nr:amino acid adenylation domain-containing protein [Bacillus subtilis]KIN31510.1 Long-chain-fatty-acid--CoA ligase [Bacillus subtilis]KIN56074.1 Long-chain-fatty-acid--CoA ligase [Bacillus subtilis]
MDLSMKIKRLPIEKSKPIIEKIRSNFYKNKDQSNKGNYVSQEKKETSEDVDLNKRYVLSKDEYDLIINNWGKGDNLNLPNKLIHELVQDQASRTPDKVALTINEESMTYSELNQKANQVAYYLRVNQAMEIENLVGVYMERSLEAIIAILAILKAGGCYIPLDPAYPKERIYQVLSDSGAQCIITDENLFNSISYKQTNIVLYNEQELSDYPQKNINLQTTQNNLAYIIYTSGSTGNPKGVQIEHRALVNFILSISEKYEISENDRIVQFAALGFDVSIFDIFAALTTGATLCLANENERKSPEQLTRLMKNKEITVAELPPALLPLLDPNNFPDLRLISVGGEMFSGELVSKWTVNGRRFMNGYGPTETTVAVTLYECEGEWSKNPPIGKPIHNVNAYVLNSHLEPVPVGVPGELYIGGNCLARGYLNKEDMTRKNFVNNPFSEKDPNRLYKTGDLVKWLPDGNIEILGRTDRQIKIRGFRVELEEIESVLLSYSYIKQALVDIHQTESQNKQLVAYLVCEENIDFKAHEIRESLKNKLPKYMVPSKFITIPKIPLTANGKVDRKALPEPDSSRPDNEGFVAPRSELEFTICADIFSPILSLDEIGALDNFFDLGGNSLQATLVVSKIRETFGIEINLIDFFQSPVVEDLAEIVKEKEVKSQGQKDDLLKQLNEMEESWLNINKVKGAKFRIVCFPYAGASTYLYQKWVDKLAPDIEVVNINLPGRDTKINELPYDSAYTVANRLASEIEQISDKPLFFMGQSGGAILAFETSRLLLKRGVKIERLFALASRAPHDQLSEPQRYHLPEEEFLERVNEFGGLSESLLNNKELLSLMLPTMRADEKLAETYFYSGTLGRFPFPISIYGGKKDRIKTEVLNKWKELSMKECKLEWFDGGHFFLQENEDQVLLSIIESIAESAFVH